MNSGDSGQEDAALLLAIKDAETNTLRQQMAQLSEDLRRNLAVLSIRDEEAMKLRSTVDALRALLAEKDNLFSQFQGQVQELEVLRIQEAEQRVVLEQLLAKKEQEWQQQQEAAQQGREAELSVMQQQLNSAEDNWTAQIMQTRQAALDESLHRTTQQQAALERSAENMQHLQQQVDSLTSTLLVKEAELQAAHRQLGEALDATKKLEATHAKTLTTKDGLILQLKQQLEQQAASINITAAEHDVNMNKLITSVNQMQESCQTQASEVQEYAAAQKRLQDERRVLRDQMKQQEATITKLQTEKGVLEAALQHEVTAQAGAQAQLNIFQAKLTEAVVELEQRCSAAEARSSQLMAQLVEERGRLVDAVIEQANSSTPQLAAELAKSLEADRLRTQAELQAAQERSRSLAEDLSLIRSTLVPLLKAPAAAVAVAAGVASPAQAANGSLAALAQIMSRKEQQQLLQQQQVAGTAAIGEGLAAFREGATGQQCYADEGLAGRSYNLSSVYAASPAAAAGAAAAAAASSAICNVGSPCKQQYQSPSRAVRLDGHSSPRQGYAYSSPRRSLAAAVVTTASPKYKTPKHTASGAAPGSSRSGTLAGLVFELQVDVDKLQQQLHNSRRQLKWDGNQSARSPEAILADRWAGRAISLIARPGEKLQNQTAVL